LIVFVKAFRVKFYTNKFNEKDMFSARKLFKGMRRDTDRSKKKDREELNVIKEEPNESYDVEKEGFRESWLTSQEHRFSDMRDTYERGSYAKEFSWDGERIQGVVRRNHLDRKTNEEPEILSLYSQDKSDDLIIQTRKFMKPNFEPKREDRINYYKEKEKFIFGYEENAAENIPKFESKPKKVKDKKKKNETENIKIKFNFSEKDSEEEDMQSTNNNEIEVNNEYGRQTIDLNGPIFDPGLVQRRGQTWLSDRGKTESEADDMNNILDQMEKNSSFKGFGKSDLDDSTDKKLNTKAYFLPKADIDNFMDIMI
jgi:hypothetical protein